MTDAIPEPLKSPSLRIASDIGGRFHVEGAEYKGIERESSVSSDKHSTDETKSREQNDNDEKADDETKRTNIEHRRAYFLQVRLLYLFVY